MVAAAGLLVAQAIMPFAMPVMAASVDPCAAFDTVEVQSKPAAGRRVSAFDLATIGDIGRSDPNESPSPFGLSPDGRRMAFVVRRAEPRTNAFCQKLLVLALDREGAPPRELDRGGAFIRDTFQLRNFPAIAAGYAKVITPKWSPDGRTIAFLKQVDNLTQVWLVKADGTGGVRQLSHLPDHVEDFAWTPDGSQIVTASRPALREAMARIGEEARSGFVFDDRFSPQFADHPLPTDPMPSAYTTVGLDGAAREATTAERALFTGRKRTPDDLPIPAGARGLSATASGAAAWIESKAPNRLIAPTRIVLRLADGSTRICSAVECDGARHLWWSATGHELYVLQKTGWGQSQTALLRWPLNAAAPFRVFLTDDALIGCLMQAPQLICAREGATHPRRLVAIDLETGSEREIYDPNKDWQTMRLGSVQRLRFRNAYGVESYADLVLPPGHKPGEKHPLVVVQYGSDGFLRGGTGDEVPVQVLAAKGFAVLSFARPDFPAWVMEAQTEVELRQRNRTDWLDRRNVQSSLDTALARAVATGTIDKDRMGISGFSDGTSTTQWALINASLFKAASLGACCEDMMAYALGAGPYFERFGREMGYRFFEDDASAFWKPMSLVLNADRVDVPILIQTGDSEYEAGLDVVSAFRKRGKAIELIVLDNEPHFKWQPAHRLAIYERTVDWFSFWLKHQMDCSPAKQGQYERWSAMRGAPGKDKLRCG
ncbi:Atxe2 family lasso peptide isopeptidase [Novosphingobium sp. SL115]|uniref:Atxe2 family lasso peptide isopeptidase n=1 Tax=Novosphingobium sp. SL115 TaxID=2995150 RepID=UPI0022728485|nr:Atxe2 family lasso peptide isopeptidase [Novosphingobium sp. SL115]MCY1669434.1 Atxe2 family lasso peptide isopeptidase [Novosphingobium sp. SL115]